MKRKLLITILCLAISISMIACGNVDTAEQQEITATEQTTETEIIEATEEDISDNGIPESKGWTDYKKTADYYIASGQATKSAMYVLNPDIYGTETAGKGTGDVPYDFIDASVDIKRLELTTTKGYPIEAYWYVEPNTVQFIYTGEVSPYGAWYTDPDSLDVLDAAFNYEKSLLDITHEQKIQILGEPTMTAEEVIAAMEVKYGMN